MVFELQVNYTVLIKIIQSLNQTILNVANMSFTMEFSNWIPNIKKDSQMDILAEKRIPYWHTNQTNIQLIKNVKSIYINKCECLSFCIQAELYYTTLPRKRKCEQIDR